MKQKNKLFLKQKKNMYAAETWLHLFNSTLLVAGNQLILLLFQMKNQGYCAIVMNISIEGFTYCPHS